jgi:hypothetical protein
VLLYCDSFDHYSHAQMARKWTTVNGGEFVAARTGYGFKFGEASAFKTLNAEYSTLVMGFAFKPDSFGNWPIRFTNAINGVMFNVEHVGDGRLRFTFAASGGNGTSPPSTYVLNAGRWYYLEAKAEITAVSPPHVLASLRINGAEILAWDYTHGASVALKFATFMSTGPPGLPALTIDDLYVTDGEFLGDIKIGVLYPNAAGDSAAWTSTPAGANWQQVEEHPADDDTSYVSAGSVGLKDLYNLDDIDPAFTGSIKGVQALWLVKKSDEGEGAVKGVWKSGVTEIVQAAGHNYLAPNGFYPSATSYLYDIQTERNSLFTATAWTKAELNALQLGITRTL